MTHTKTNVIQYSEYYPFGLQTSNSWTKENTSNNFLFNQSTELNPTTGLYDLTFRNYDPVLGRFHQVDPLAARFSSTSPYAYANNDPVFWNDPHGDSFLDELHEAQYAAFYGPFMDGISFGYNASFGPGSDHAIGNVIYLHFPDFTIEIDWNSVPIGGTTIAFSNGRPVFRSPRRENFNGTSGYVTQHHGATYAVNITYGNGVPTLIVANRSASDGSEEAGLVVLYAQQGVRPVNITIGGSPTGSGLTWSYPNNDGNIYKIPTYAMTVSGTDASGNAVSRTFQVFRFGVNRETPTSRTRIVGLANTQSYTIQRGNQDIKFIVPHLPKMVHGEYLVVT